jgi:hypothetical protein
VATDVGADVDLAMDDDAADDDNPHDEDLGLDPEVALPSTPLILNKNLSKLVLLLTEASCVGRLAS